MNTPLDASENNNRVLYRRFDHLALLVGIAVRANVPAMVHVLHLGGLELLWVIPYRTLFFLLYAATG